MHSLDPFLIAIGKFRLLFDSISNGDWISKVVTSGLRFGSESWMCIGLGARFFLLEYTLPNCGSSWFIDSSWLGIRGATVDWGVGRLVRVGGREVNLGSRISGRLFVLVKFSSRFSIAWLLLKYDASSLNVISIETNYFPIGGW